MATDAQAMAQIASLWGTNSPMQEDDPFDDEELVSTPKPKALCLAAEGTKER